MCGKSKCECSRSCLQVRNVREHVRDWKGIATCSQNSCKDLFTDKERVLIGSTISCQGQYSGEVGE